MHPTDSAAATHQEAPRLVSSMPLCNIGLNFSVRGKGTLAVREVGGWGGTLMRVTNADHVCGWGTCESVLLTQASV